MTDFCINSLTRRVGSAGRRTMHCVSPTERLPRDKSQPRIFERRKDNKESMQIQRRVDSSLEATLKNRRAFGIRVQKNLQESQVSHRLE
jgi:hypothetical protein